MTPRCRCISTLAPGNVTLGEKRLEWLTHGSLTDELWELMKSCWDQDPHRRPKMSEVLRILRGSSVSLLLWRSYVYVSDSCEVAPLPTNSRHHYPSVRLSLTLVGPKTQSTVTPTKPASPTPASSPARARAMSRERTSALPTSTKTVSVPRSRTSHSLRPIVFPESKF